ncbi:MAG: hypothetical protein GXN95_00910 [Methanococci archaeon]|nr:hypothetical protein [Methanococci archaeon]
MKMLKILDNIQKHLINVNKNLERKEKEIESRLKELHKLGKKYLTNGDLDNAQHIACQLINVERALKLIKTYKLAIDRAIYRIDGLKDLLETIGCINNILEIDISSLNTEDVNKIKNNLNEAKNVLYNLEETLVGIEKLVSMDEIASVISKDEMEVMKQWMNDIRKEVSFDVNEIEYKLNKLEKMVI